MIRTLRLTLMLLVAAVAAHAQTAGTGVAATAVAADSFHTATPAAMDSLEPAAIPPTANSIPSASTAASPLPTRPHVLAIRTEPVIRIERDQMQVLAEGAGAELVEARRARAEVRGAIDIKKKEGVALEARLKAAKQSRDDAARTALEGERKRHESVRGYFEHLLEVHDAAIDEAQARGDDARAAISACDWELQLAGRSGLAANDGDPALFKLEQQYLDAVRSRSRTQERLATRAQTYADRRLRIYRAWADWLGGR